VFDVAAVMADAQRKESLTEQVDERFTLYNKRIAQHIGGTAHA
jgi:hypothetical protein